MKRDFYEILGIPRNADKETIRKAYRKLARQYHPDVNPHDKTAEKRFKEISEAYKILSDVKSRRLYDRSGHAAFRRMREDMSGSGRKSGGFDVRFNASEFSGKTASESIKSIFREFFRDKMKSEKAGKKERGRDITYPMEIDFDQMYRGMTATISIPVEKFCAACGGKGFEPGSVTMPCPECGGSGQKFVTKGPLKYAVTCERCKGEGHVRDSLCQACRGKRVRRKMEKIPVRIPPGIDTGYRIQAPKKGEAGKNGGEQGDLYIVVRVKPHEFFSRKGANLELELPITIDEAVLGARIDVPTPEGKARMTVPPGTPSGKVFRLAGKGLPRLNRGGRGDLMIKVGINVPSVSDEESRRLIREFAYLNKENPRKRFFKVPNYAAE